MQPLAMPSRVEDSPAALLFGCLQKLGARDSNPVLELLRDIPTFVQGDKYPQPALAFGAGNWRSYYHSHCVADTDLREHGHFHLFTRKGEGWAHLAALAMDVEGQPLRWIITNRWVTGSDWHDRNSLLAAIRALAPAEEPDLLRQWLTSLLTTYQRELGELLTARDTTIAGRLQGQAVEEVLDDRSLYELASLPINLAAKLAAQLNGEI